MRYRHAILLPVVLVLGAVRPATAAGDVVVQEPIPDDPRDDIAMGVVVEGDLPAAIRTRSGVVSAPDPNKAPTHDEVSASSFADSQAGGGTFTPDRDTRRPDTLPYQDPFTPATAPFKRLVAYDAVDDHFSLYVYDAHLDPLPIQEGSPASTEDQFYADVPLALSPSRHVRIPSVGPGTRVLHAHLSAGSRELPFRLVQDGAENWFVDATESVDARLVMDLAIPRAAFGGDFGDPPWMALPAPPTVPSNVTDAVNAVATQIGVGRQLGPRENVQRLVAYFRSFTDSDRPLAASRDVYTDLALSRKGVCRHRAYAFTVTALGIGIPTRMVMNEAHAWVEVNDGTEWRRIDLGGAGQMLSDSGSAAVPYSPPPDPFAWPAGATRGQDLGDVSRARPNPNAGPAPGATAASSGGSQGASAPRGAGTAGTSASSPGEPARPDPNDARPGSSVTLALAEADALRGGALHVHGTVSAGGSACPHVPVDVILRAPKTGRESRVGTMATDDAGGYSGAIVLPSSVPLGDYVVVARTEGDARCGRGGSAP